jgi:hypothetical protein
VGETHKLLLAPQNAGWHVIAEGLPPIASIAIGTPVKAFGVSCYPGIADVCR